MGLSLPVPVVSSIYPATWFKSLSKSSACRTFRELLPSSLFSACLQALPFLHPLHPSFHSLFVAVAQRDTFSPAMTLRLLGSPFPLSCSPLDTVQPVLCQSTVSTAVGFCHLTSSFHPCEAILQMCSLSFTPLYYSFPSCFHVSTPAVSLTQAVTHSETQRVTSHATQSCAGDYQDVPAAAGL